MLDLESSSFAVLSLSPILGGGEYGAVVQKLLRKWEQTYLAYFVAGFFDESTDEDTQGLCYTVAGFIGNYLTTAVLEMRWADLLKKYEIKYFKASELSAGQGQFKKFRDDSKAKNWKPFSCREKKFFDQAKTDFTDVIMSCRSGLYAIAVSVILPDLELLRSEYAQAAALPMPYFLATGWAIMEAGSLINEWNTGHRPATQCWLRPIFDQQEEYSGHAKKAWDSFRDKNPISSKFLFPIHYEASTEYLTLQAADNLAFEARKFVCSRKKKLKPRISLGRIVKPGNLAFYDLDYHALKTIADAQTDAPSEQLKNPLRQTCDVADVLMETYEENSSV